jgi:hypothetical protein
MTPSDLTPYLRFTANGRAVELRIPSLRRISGMLQEAQDLPFRIDDLARSSWSLAMHFVAAVDARPMRWDLANSLVADAELIHEIFARIRTLLDTLRERGKVFVQCPGCRAWEVEVPFTAYALTIAEPIPSAFDGYDLVPHLGAGMMRGSWRAKLPRTPRVRCVLPSSVLGLPSPIKGAVLNRANYHPDEKDEEVIDDDDDDENEEDLTDENIRPNRSGAGWRAVVRLSRALEPALSIEDTERLPAIDFFFLDLVYYLIAFAPVRADTAGKITCGTCSTVFLPVLPEPEPTHVTVWTVIKR